MPTNTDNLYNRNPENYSQPGVLIIEDNPDHWAIMQAALRHFLPRTQSIWASGATAAFSYLDECSVEDRRLPKLILLDLYLPDREQGWQLLQVLKQHPRYHQVPVVMMSYSDSPDDIRGSYQEGTASYIVKPTDYQQWLVCFQMLKTYWWDIVRLPTVYS